MTVGDEAFFYHSNIGKEIVGIAQISKAGFQDPSDDTGRWTSVKVKPVRKLKRPVTLTEIKADLALAEMELLTKFRLSVAKVSRMNGSTFSSWRTGRRRKPCPSSRGGLGP